MTPSFGTRHLIASGAARPIADLIEPLVEEAGFRLIRVVLGGGARRCLQVMAERADGSMSVDDCALLSSKLSAFLDERDPIRGSYALEVSSPGIERPLCRSDDFDRWSGHAARIELSEPIEGHRRWSGRLAGVEKDCITIKVDSEQIVAIPASTIARARLLGEVPRPEEKS